MNSLLRLDFAETWAYGIDLLFAGERDADPMLIVEGEYVLGVTAFWQGEFPESRRHLEVAIDRYASGRHETHVAMYSQDPKVVCLSRLAWTLCILGDPDDAADARDAALSLAEELGHPFSRCYAILYGAIVSQELHDEPLRAELVTAAEALATDEGFHLLQAWATILRHWSLARRGDRAAIAGMKATISRLEETEQMLLNPYFLTLLARAYLAASEPLQGLDVVAHALATTQQRGFLCMESELQRLRAELLVASGSDPADIETAFGLAAETARRQGATALGLRAAGELARWRASRGAVMRRA